MKDFGFKFEIGEIVTTKAAVASYTNLPDDEGKRYSPQDLFIIERTLQQCPGGIQRHYHCRSGAMRTGYNSEYGCTKDIFIFNEIELITPPKQIKEKKKK